MPASINLRRDGIMGTRFVMIMVLAFLSSHQSAFGIRFVLDREECVYHSLPREGEWVQVSFVVIKVEGRWQFGNDGIDLEVKDPLSDQVYHSRDKTIEKFEFVVRHEGLHKFCFKNKSPHQETVDFDIHVRHFSYLDQHATDEHLNPLMEQISKLEQALYDIQFEQHWLEAQTDRQAILNEGMSSRAIHKAMLESAALVGASILQVYLLRRLFDRKLGTCRV